MKSLLIDESAPQDVVQPIRAIVARPAWVADVRALHVIFVGPAALLVIARLVPASEVAAEPAHALITRVDALRQELLRMPTVADVALTVEES